MEQEELKIYDIVDLPIFAYTPSIELWIIILVLALVVFIFYKRVNKSKEIRLMISAMDQALNDLTHAAKGLSANPKESLIRASIIVRRFLETHSFLFHPALSSLTVQSISELKNLLEIINSKPLSQILETLIKIEQLRFEPEVSFEVASVNIRELERELEIIKNHHPFSQGGNGINKGEVINIGKAQ